MGDRFFSLVNIAHTLKSILATPKPMVFFICLLLCEYMVGVLIDTQYMPVDHGLIASALIVLDLLTQFVNCLDVKVT